MTFYKWIMTNYHGDRSPYGELAAYLLADDRVTSASEVRHIEDYLRNINAPEAIVWAFKDVERQWLFKQECIDGQ